MQLYPGLVAVVVVPAVVLLLFARCVERLSQTSLLLRKAVVPSSWVSGYLRNRSQRKHGVSVDVPLAHTEPRRSSSGWATRGCSGQITRKAVGCCWCFRCCYCCCYAVAIWVMPVEATTSITITQRGSCALFTGPRFSLTIASSVSRLSVSTFRSCTRGGQLMSDCARPFEGRTGNSVLVPLPLPLLLLRICVVLGEAPQPDHFTEKGSCALFMGPLVQLNDRLNHKQGIRIKIPSAQKRRRAAGVGAA